MFDRILLFGYGTMASAMLEGWLASGLEPQHFTVYNPRSKAVPAGVAFTVDLPDGRFDALVLAVKPQKLDEVADAVASLAGPETMLVSILAGVDLAALAHRFSRARGIARMMPNLAVAIGKSPNVLVGRKLDQTSHAGLTDLAARLGSAEWLEDEAQIDLIAALTASGPGFVYRFMDALAAGAGELGLDPVLAQRLAVQTVAGAAALASSSAQSPPELARRVASPGGMTQKGLDVLDNNSALERLITLCLAAARDRAGELAAAARD